jgi:hypothetical protein
MKNYWLQRRPSILQQLNLYADYYGKRYIFKRSDDLDSDLYLHKNSVWRVTTFNINTGNYTGYFDTEKDAQETLNNS